MFICMNHQGSSGILGVLRLLYESVRVSELLRCLQEPSGISKESLELITARIHSESSGIIRVP